MESIAILVIEKGRARVVRFRVELAGEASWSLASHTLPEAVTRLRPDLVTVVENEDRARRLAEEFRRQGRADAVIFLHPDSVSAPGQTHISLPGPVDPRDPKQLVLNLAQALLQSQGREPVNPLTGMPGAASLRAEVERRLAAEEVFTFLYLDLDNFKAYNDSYGFAQGDEAIKQLAEEVKKALAQHGEAEDLAVHIGGDDFGILTRPARAGKLAETLVRAFDALAPSLYQEPERSRGYLAAMDRRGNEARYPLMTLSVAGVSNEQRHITGYLHLSEIAAEIKAYAKLVTGSVYVQDRRRNQVDSSQ